MEFAPEDVDPSDTARAIKTLVTPRPIAWVSSQRPDGVENLAPFSAYNYASHVPPVLHFSTSKRDGALKDTASPAVAPSSFSFNVVTAEHIEVMDRTSEDLPADESEFEHAGIERADCTVIDAPRVADAAATMECRLHDTVEVYDRLVIYGEVVYVHIDDDLLTDGKVDSRNVDTVGRLGGPYYTVAKPVEFERQY
jgi:flavin reductase (DIM6/NTAB) family NADH-FMN oxidoreductase RutF